LRDKLRDSGFPSEVVRAGDGASARYDVRIGSLPDATEAAALAARLKALGFAQARAS
jgi:hypothetical protein